MKSARSASQKTGVLTPKSDTMRAPWSNQLLRRRAETMPRLTPTTEPKRMAAVASSMVAGRNDRRSSMTGRRLLMERPRSPCTSFVR